MFVPAVFGSDQPPPETAKAPPQLKIEPIVMAGENIPVLTGEDVQAIRLYAINTAGKLHPIPFQIDEKISKLRPNIEGEALFDMSKPKYVLDGDEDKDKSFDKDDELVFMAFDAGIKADEGSINLGQKKFVEIAVMPEASSVTLYAYALVFDGAPPEYSSTKYVSYYASTDTVQSDKYRVGYPELNALNFDEIAIPQSNNGNNEDFIDAFKSRVLISIMWNVLMYSLDDNDAINNLVGVKTGPIRIIRRVDAQIEGYMFVIKKFKINQIYYRDFFQMNIGTSSGWNGPKGSFVADISWTVDLNEKARGMKFINSENPNPVTIDGILSEDEKSMSYGPWDWNAVTGDPGTMIMSYFQPEASRTYGDLYYMDDVKALDPPENEPGQIGNFGVTARNMERVGKGKNAVNFFFYFPDKFVPESVETLSDMLDKPLYVTAGDKEAEAIKRPPVPKADTREEDEAPKPSYITAEREPLTRGFIPQIIIDPNLGYGSGIQVIDRDFLKKGISFDFLFIITHRLFQMYRLEVQKMDYFDWLKGLKIYAEFSNHPNRFFYGLGNDTKDDELTVYKQTQGVLRLTYERKVLGDFGVEGGYVYRDTRIGHGDLFTRVEPSIEEKFGLDETLVGERFGPPVFGLDGGLSSSLLLGVFRDTRDSIEYTTRGTRLGFTAEYFGPEIGSDFRFTRIEADARAYLRFDFLNRDKKVPRNFYKRKLFGPDKNRVLAFRLAAQKQVARKVKFDGKSVDDIPFYENSFIGDGFTSRGYFLGRFRDKDRIFMNAEYRFVIWKVMDAVVFYDTGRVFNEIEEGSEWANMNFNDLHSSVGWGFRFHLPPDLVMRMDIGFSPESPGGLFYAQGQQTF